MATEYIEKQAARPDEFCVGVSCQECPFLKDPLYGGCRVDDFIMALPPADVRPVRRGRWVDENIYKQTMSGKTYDGFTYCSNCKHDFSFGYRSKFCPDCGSNNCADMMGGDAE